MPITESQPYANFTFASAGFTTVKQTTRVITDPTPDGFMFAVKFQFTSGGWAYLGFQTKDDAGDKCAVFAVEGAAVSGSGTSVDIDSDFFGSTGITITQTYPWLTGQSYTFKMERGSLDVDGRNWTASVAGASGTFVDIGTIKVPTSWGTIPTSGHSALMKRFSGDVTSCDMVNYAVVEYTSIIGGTSTTPNAYTYGVTSGSCNAYSSSAAITGGVHQEMGRAIEPPPPSGASDWVFSGTLTLRKRFTNLSLTIETLTAPLGKDVEVRIYEGVDLVHSDRITDLNVPSIIEDVGHDSTVTTLTYTLTGTPVSTGNGYISFYLSDGSEIKDSLVDTLLITT